MRRLKRYSISFVWLFWMPLVLCAQSVQVSPRPIAEALRALMAETPLKVVFSARIVENKTTSCVYQGNNPVSALHCILSQSNLEAHQSSTGQWIITQKPYAEHSGNNASATPKVNSIPESIPAYSLSATVMDAQTRQTLPGASVLLLHTTIGAITDEKGEFHIENLPQSIYQIRVSFVGYESQVMNLTATQKQVVISLKPIAIEAASFVVDGNAVAAMPVRIAEGAYTLSATELAKQVAFQGQEDLFQLLGNTTPVNRSSEMNGDLIIRGSEDGQNLYLVDNVPVYSPQRSFGQFTLFQSDLLQDVTLYKGSMPALFGGRLSSLVAAELKDGKRDRLHVTTGISRYSGRVMLETPLTAKASLMIANRISLSDIFDLGMQIPIQQVDGMQELPVGYTFRDFTSKLSLHPHRQHQVSFNFYRGSDVLQAKADEMSYAILRNTNDYWDGINSDIRQSWKSGYESARYRYLHSPQFLVTVTTYHTGYQSKESNVVNPSKPLVSTTEVSNAKQSVASYDAQMDERGVKIETDYVTPIYEAQIGGSVVRYQYDSALNSANVAIRRVDTAVTSHLLTETAIYSNNIIHLSPKFQIEPGLRVGAVDRFAFFLPQFFARYEATRWMTAKVGISTQAQQLHWLRDRFAQVINLETGLWETTDRLHIRPSRSTQYSASLETKPASGITWDIDVYWRKSWNVLIAQNPYRLRSGLDKPLLETSLKPELYQPGNSVGYGLETSFKLQRKQWQSHLNYSFGRSQSEFLNNDQSASFPARFDAPHAFNGSLRWNSPLLYIMVLGEVRTGYPVNVVAPNQEETNGAWAVQGNEVRTKRLRTYRRVDAVLGREFKSPKVNALLELQFFNLTNSKNVLDQTIGSSSQPLELSGTRFTPSFSLKLSF